MKNPKIGEWVRAYDNFQVRWHSDGKVTSVNADRIQLDEKAWYDRRQCVRLVKKKRREFWVVKHSCSIEAPLVYDYKPGQSSYICPSSVCAVDVIHVREVKKK